VTALFANEDGEVELTRGPGQRHASLEAGISHDEILAAELTRLEARALAAALLAYAETPDPGPGAPYPMTERMAASFDSGGLHPDSLGFGFGSSTQTYGSWHGVLQRQLDLHFPSA
jgi:hypothetical protein